MHKEETHFDYLLTLAVLLMLPSIVMAQDTISVYFDFGSSKLNDKQLRVINSIPSGYDLSQVDSLNYIGMADSVGNFKSNLRLSEKRAKNVAKYCETLFPKTIKTRTFAIGEVLGKKDSESRRVDIVLYSEKVVDEVGIGEMEKEEETIIPDTGKVACYYVDYPLLQGAHVRKVKKGRREMVMIEMVEPIRKGEKDHYTGHVNQEGQFEMKKVKWRSRRTGNLWWAKQRTVALVPKEDYEKFRIFKTNPPPCTVCNEDFENVPKRTNYIKITRVDRFLMNNMQYKVSFFNRKTVKARVPREYVNLEDNYYLGKKIEWKTKGGKKNKNYYFIDLSLHGSRISNILREMEYCEIPAPSYSWYGDIYCATNNFHKMPTRFAFTAEVGSYYQQSELIPYIAIGSTRAGYHHWLYLLAGTDIDLGLYGSFRYQYSFWSFPFFALNPISNWKSATGEKVEMEKYAQVYVGTELKNRINERETLLEQNLHLGISGINTKCSAFIQRVFIQYGVGTDYLALNNFDIYGVAQVGVDMKIAWFPQKDKKPKS